MGICAAKENWLAGLPAGCANLLPARWARFPTPRRNARFYFARLPWVRVGGFFAVSPGVCLSHGRRHAASPCLRRGLSACLRSRPSKMPRKSPKGVASVLWGQGLSPMARKKRIIAPFGGAPAAARRGAVKCGAAAVAFPRQSRLRLCPLARLPGAPGFRGFRPGGCGSLRAPGLRPPGAKAPAASGRPCRCAAAKGRLRPLSHGAASTPPGFARPRPPFVDFSCVPSRSGVCPAVKVGSGLSVSANGQFLHNYNRKWLIIHIFVLLLYHITLRKYKKCMNIPLNYAFFS